MGSRVFPGRRGRRGALYLRWSNIVQAHGGFVAFFM